MRVTEQIDALDIMGVNSANYLILPKITALVTFIPILVAFSMFTGLFGGYLVSMFTDYNHILMNIISGTRSSNLFFSDL